MEKDEIEVYSSYGAAIKSVKEHEIATNTKFISVARTKNALVTDVPYVEDHVVRFEDLRGEVPVIYDGVPFVQVGTEVRECHQGPIRKNKEKVTGDHVYSCEAESDPTNKRKSIQVSKKVGCTAKIKFRMLIKFPKYKITGQPTKQARKETIQRVKEAMLEENDQQYSVYVRYCGQHHDHATGGIKTRQSVQCKSLEEALGVLKQHEAEHKYKYSTIKATKGFGNIDIRYGKKIFWEDKKSIIHGRQNFNGVPFFILGQKGLDCQFGKNRKKTPKDVEGKVEVSPQGTYTDSKPVVLQPTKKRDCPAKCVIREICKFPTYRVDSMPTKDEKNMINMDVIRKCRSGVDIPYERTFILCLPLEEDHTCEPGDEVNMKYKEE